MLLLDAVDPVPPPRPVVVALAEPPGPVAEADAVTLTPDKVGVTTTVEEVGKADCAAVRHSREQRASNREK